ncbi:MAG: glycosyltransferase [Verrucomicrobia bacterium]|nr:glycosyltransferase [Verrucomicrobiota bacterium]
MNQRLLIVFVKAPRPGTVKTRLARVLGASQAAAAYRILAETMLRGLEGVPAVELRFTPDDAEAEVRPWLRGEWHMRPQGAGDLGERMHRAFVEGFAGGAALVAIVGSDCPAVAREDIEGAWAVLAEADVVLGPAADGGYWLIGLRRPCAGLFEGLRWSGPDVLRETLARAQALGLRAGRLRELADVDEAEDWQRYLDQRARSVTESGGQARPRGSGAGRCP